MFDRYVSEKRPSWKRRAVLIASLAAHGVVGVGLLIGGLLHVAEIAPPALAIVFVSTPEPAPPESPPPARRTQHAAKATAQPASSAARTAVTTTPEVAPPTAPPSPSPSPSVAPPGPGGGHDGPPGNSDGPGGNGPPGSDPNGPGIDGPAPRPRNIGPHLLDAQKIAGSEPHLPEFVRAARRGLGDSAFMARLCVDQSGRVSRVDVLQGIAGADEAIVSALRGWRYRAQAIPVCFVSRFVFDVQ